MTNNLEGNQKSVISNLIEYIEEVLVGQNNFNQYNCNLAFTALVENQKDLKIYLNTLEKNFLQFSFPEFKRKNMIDFLKLFDSNLSNSMIELTKQYNVYLRTENHSNSKTALTQRHNQFIANLENFASNQEII